jgi:cytidylate kinase
MSKEHGERKSCQRRRGPHVAGADGEVIMAITTDRVYESLARLNRFLESQMHSAQEKGRTAPPEPITIALSRQAGSGGSQIARAVGAQLGWPVYDHELLDRIAEEKGLSKRLVEHLDERCPGWLEEVFRSFSTKEVAREGGYIRGLIGLLGSLSMAGHCVIVGRGAAQTLPAETTLTVRVVAPRPDRVARVQKRTDLSAAEADRWVETHDRERRQFVERHFHLNPDDPMLYDLVLSTKRLDIDECATLIVQAARALEAKRATKSRT